MHVCKRSVYVTNASAGHQSQYNCIENKCLGGTTLEQGVTELEQRSFVMGGVLWSGFDYLGEPAPYPWPERNSNWGIHDLAGFRKDMYYYYRAAWTTAPVLHLFPHWNWAELLPGGAGNVSVWAFTNADSVHLSLNGVPLPEQPPQGRAVPKMGHANWSVSFVAGTLTAIGYKDGEVSCNASVSTATAPARIELTLVAPKSGILLSNGQDSALVSATVLDAHGVPVPDASHRIHFATSSRQDAEVVGVANGDPANHEPTRGAKIAAFHGKAAAVIRVGGGLSDAVRDGIPSLSLTVTASAIGLKSGEVSLQLHPCPG